MKYVITEVELSDDSTVFDVYLSTDDAPLRESVLVRCVSEADAVTFTSKLVDLVDRYTVEDLVEG